MHGQFVWYELTTSDVEAAKKFYPRFTGWATQRFDNDYTMWTTGGAPFAGIFRLGPEQRAQGIPSNWMAYVETSNVDETARLAASLGGKVVHGPAEIPGTGRFAVLQDPQGAVFGIYKSSTASQGWDGTPVVGRFSWHELMTTDYVKAAEFYRKLFGWEKTGEMDMGGGSMYFMFGQGTTFGGMFNRPPDMAAMSPFWMYYIHVKDVDKAVAIATQAGATLHRGPMEIPGGAIAILGDPQGAGFAVHHNTAPAAAAKTAAKPASKTAAKPASKPAAKPAARKAARTSSRPKSRRNTKAKPGAKAKARARAKAATRERPASKASRRKRSAKARRRR